MLIERIIENFRFNKPILTEDIFECMPEYSPQRIYQIISEEIEKETLVRYDTGIYYLPTETKFGQSVISLTDVIIRKYIQNDEEVFGIFGKNIMDLNFSLSYQVPNIIEVITNKESRDVRVIEIRGRKVVLQKSRLPITSENASAYTLMELFNGIYLQLYKEDEEVRKNILKFIEEEAIDIKMIYDLASYFPSKVMKNLATSGVLYEITQR